MTNNPLIENDCDVCKAKDGKNNFDLIGYDEIN